MEDVWLLRKAGSRDITALESEEEVPDRDILGSRETTFPSYEVEVEFSIWFNREVRSRESSVVVYWRSFIGPWIVDGTVLFAPPKCDFVAFAASGAERFSVIEPNSLILRVV